VSKLERLLNLTAALLETPRLLTAEEIRRRVPGYPEGTTAFRRAFERDKEDLREMGVPLLVEERPGTDPPIEGYRIPKDEYYLRDPGLAPDELAALHLAASAVRLDGLEGIEALWKLGGVVGDDGPARPAVASLPTSPALPALFAAVAERRPARFRYHGEEREVDPYRLDFARGRWYVSGYDHLREDERQFRLDRIDGPVELGEPGSYERPSTAVPGARVQPWQLGEGEPVVARLLVDADQAPWATHHVGADAVVARHGDGSVELAVPVSNRPAFRSFVLTFLDHAEVLGPPELRDEVVAWLEAMCPG
jgi:predicted DNA-binding transcriptional regulator YafY